MPDNRPLIETPLPTALGTFNLTVLRDRSIHVATGNRLTVTVSGMALTVNAQLNRDEDGRWQLHALFAEPPDRDGVPGPRAGDDQHAALRRVLVPAVQAWADANPYALWYVEWLHVRDQQLREVRRLRDYFVSVEDIVHAMAAARQRLAVTEAHLAAPLDPPPTAPPAVIPEE